MFLRYVSVKNFRALADVEAEFDNRINVIVGPNASGKTTLLEAIRLAKAVLAPRTQNEANQSLIAIGAISPHMPGRLRPEAIARNQGQPTIIRTRYQLEPEEISAIEDAIPQIATNLTLSQLGQQFSSPAAALGFLSSDPGKDELRKAEDQLKGALSKLHETRECRLELTVDYATGRMSGSDPFGQTFFSFLEQRFPPNVTGFSYFPADRALPIGEPAVQFGGGDVANQMEAHNSQPQLKYARLKNVIFSTIISSKEGRENLDHEFQNIFDRLLRGRALENIGINEIGLLSIKIKDTETGRVFDFDGLSSGEKNLILTSLTISRSIADRGIVLLDEPELHLNPAVCKDILGFFQEFHTQPPRSIQLLLCSHSVEILNAIFDRDECALYHLASEASLTRVHKQDRGEISEALRRLGTSEAEGLLYKGTIFLEGEHDVELLEAGFPSLLRKYILKELGGRGGVERQISRLQAGESKGHIIPSTFFIFDNDRNPTSLNSTRRVKILQWDRYCLENYLLDKEVIGDLLMSGDIAPVPFPNRNSVEGFMKKLWERQLYDEVIKSVYREYALDFPMIKGNDLSGQDFASAANLICERMENWADRLNKQERHTWIEDFVSLCDEKLEKLHMKWERNWQNLCNGKRFFQDISKEIPLRMPNLQFKKRVMNDMALEKRCSWKLIESALVGFLSISS